MTKVIVTVENRKSLGDSANIKEFESDDCASEWVMEHLLQFIDRKDLHKCYDAHNPCKVRLVKNDGVVLTFWLVD